MSQNQVPPNKDSRQPPDNPTNLEYIKYLVYLGQTIAGILAGHSLFSLPSLHQFDQVSVQMGVDLLTGLFVSFGAFILVGVRWKLAFDMCKEIEKGWGLAIYIVMMVVEWTIPFDLQWTAQFRVVGFFFLLGLLCAVGALGHWYFSKYACKHVRLKREDDAEYVAKYKALQKDLMHHLSFTGMVCFFLMALCGWALTAQDGLVMPIFTWAAPILVFLAATGCFILLGHDTLDAAKAVRELNRSGKGDQSLA